MQRPWGRHISVVEPDWGHTLRPQATWPRAGFWAGDSCPSLGGLWVSDPAALTLDAGLCPSVRRGKGKLRQREDPRRKGRTLPHALPAPQPPQHLLAARC